MPETDDRTRNFLIVPPPGIVPATPSPIPTPDRSAPLISVPGAPLESATHRMTSAAAVAPPRAAHDESDTITLRPTVAWRLDLPFDLPSVALSGIAVLGRNPAAVDRVPNAALVAIADPAKSVSKTHALIEVDGDALWVTDLDSTNGTAVDGAPLVAGTRSKVADGSVVTLGDFAMRATRR